MIVYDYSPTFVEEPCARDATSINVVLVIAGLAVEGRFHTKGFTFTHEGHYFCSLGKVSK
jgi:hypothetical protein